MENNDNRSLKELADEVLFIQDGVNPVAILGGWQRSVKRLIALGFESGEVLTHPISLLFLSKMSSLSRVQEQEPWFSLAYDQVQDLCEGK